MERSIRLIEMAQLLGGRRSWRPAELARRFDISERTAYRDIQCLLRLESVPIAPDEHGGYRLKEPATLRWLALTATERATLKLLLVHPAFRKATKLTRKLEEKLDAATRLLEETPPALAFTGPERSGANAGELLPMLEEAVQKHNAVSLCYHSLWSGWQRWRDLDPYAVFHRDNVWYVVGHCHLRDDLRTFRLDRIVMARRLDRSFEPRVFDLEVFLENAWGVYRSRTLHEVVIHFDVSMAPLIEHGGHHPEQRVSRLGNGSLEYRVTVSHLDDIARWVVGFAGAARVVAPDALVKRVTEIASGAWERHQPNGRPADADGQPQLPGVPTAGAGSAEQPELL